MLRFQISVKAVIVRNGEYLLRKNERKEWELLGGRIENLGESLEHRLRTELLEESGITIDIREPREPWLYNMGNARTVIIAPYYCRAINVPTVLEDEDGGEVSWHAKKDLEYLNMPDGYFDSINRKPPRNSYSTIPENPETELLLKPKTVRTWKPFPEFEPRVVIVNALNSDERNSGSISAEENIHQSAMNIANAANSARLVNLEFRSFSTENDTFIVRYEAYYDQ
jgi:ADP-ribose pyrophosphatase YjhB (NUDIX family)